MPLLVLSVLAPVLAATIQAPANEAPTKPPTAAVEYMVVQPQDTDPLELYSPAQLEGLEMLNRVNAARLGDLARMVVPRTWVDDPLRYAPFPRVSDWAARHPKALIVHQPSQAFGAYEKGHLVRWGPVSTGREALPTPSGVFHLNWRSRGRRSTVNPDWYMPWYFNFQNTRGLSFHEYALPGRPASHACIRLLERDAKWLFEWGEQWTLDERGWNVIDPGTPLWIVGQYEFSRPPPWQSLEWLAQGITLPPPPDTPAAAASR